MSDLFSSDNNGDGEIQDRFSPRPQTVGQLLYSLRQFVEAHFHHIWVEGEISNWTRAGSGHVYFSMRDQKALINCVMWRSTAQKLKQNFTEGDMVEAKGRLSVYEPRGQVQLVIESLKPVGAGLLYQKFLELKDKLEKEGLFDPSLKKPIPILPKKIGIVTSPSGAAIRDILSVLERRAPGIEVLIYPTKVQGAGAGLEISKGLSLLGSMDDLDVIIVTRGGGSLEDLWEFNNENLAREIANCSVPVISAVGHEVDFSICDFVADLRAPTPSAAAEVVSENQAAVRERIMELVPRLHRAIDYCIDSRRNAVQQMLQSYALQSPLHQLELMVQRRDDLMARLDDSIVDRIDLFKRRVERSTSALAGHNPKLILQKGYAIARNRDGDKVVTSAMDAKKVKEMSLEFVDGKVEVDFKG